MKSLTVLFSLFSLFVFSTVSFGSGIKPNTPSLEKQIQSLFLSHLEDVSEYGNTDVKVNFLVTSKSELIVLGTNNPKMDDLIKSVLNYKKVSIGDLEYEKVYTIPLAFKSLSKSLTKH